MNSEIMYAPHPAGRKRILDHLEAAQYKRVIDIGASANPWTRKYMTHYFDLVAIPGIQASGFIGHLGHVDDWGQVLADVARNGKFDYAVCTHTLEDVYDPEVVVKMLGKVAHRGFNAVPSKYMELSRVEGPWLGYYHHHWIYNNEGNDIVAYPKFVFVEHMPELRILQQKRTADNFELQWSWKDECAIKIIHDTLGPSSRQALASYSGLLGD